MHLLNLVGNIVLWWNSATLVSAQKPEQEVIIYQDTKNFTQFLYFSIPHKPDC